MNAKLIAERSEVELIDAARATSKTMTARPEPSGALPSADI